MFKRNTFFFIGYLFLTIGLSALLHRDVLFNSFNFGRHWDWSFFSFIEMYQNYVQSFFYVIGNDALGTYGSITINDFVVKASIILLQSIFSFISIPILNKIVVFVLFPVVTSWGIWSLVKAVDEYTQINNRLHLFLIAVFANLLYTFSLPVIYDLHGGALNRQVSTVVLPFFFAYIYRYLKEERSYKYLIFSGALSIFLDIANMFYVSAIIGLVILLRSSSLYSKIKDFLIYAVSVLLVNAYWLQSIFLSQNIDPIQIINDRRLDVGILRNYSAPFKQLLFMTSSPHNLVETVFKNNFLIYLPAIAAISIVLWQINILLKQGQKKAYKETLIAICVFIFTTILVSGTYSIGNLYLFLYSFPLLGFIQNSVRFSPNLNLSLIFCLLILITQNSNSKNRAQLGIISATIVIWISFLIFNGSLIKKTYSETTKESSANSFVVNHEIGSLFKPDSSLLERLEGDKFVGNLLPIPSSNSPIFVNNFYPKTSQGSDADLEYRKGTLQTAGNDSVAERFIRSQLALQSPSTLLQAMNVQYVWVSGNYMKPDKVNLGSHFSQKWLTKVLNEPTTPLEKDQRLNTLYKVKNDHLTPVLYLEKNETKKEESKTKMIAEYKKINDTKYLLIVHNPEPVFNLVLNKQFYPDWKATAMYQEQTRESLPQLNIDSYRVLKPNESTQATTAELIDFIGRGYISSLGDGTEKTIQFHTYKNGLRTLKREERFTIDYISKIFKNSIQNDNLIEPDSKNRQMQIPDSNHKVFNGYANSWIIDTSKLCNDKPCMKKNGQSLTILVEFKSQLIYQFALLISGISFFVCLLIYISMFKKRNP